MDGPPMTLGRPELVESRLRAWGRSVFAATVVVVLVGLGIANIVQRAEWRQVEDGVFWADRAEGVTAADVALGSPAAQAGITRGDILLAVNGAPVQTRADVLNAENRGGVGTRLNYTLIRLGARQAVAVSLDIWPEPRAVYFVLAAVGLFTLLVGAWVRLRRPRDQATLHFFWLCVAFFGCFTFSFNGPFDSLDWIFYWGDAVATALLPPLMLHFTLVFPERPRWRPAVRSPWLVPGMYAPAVVLAAARIAVVSRGALDGPMLSRAIDILDRSEHIYLTVCLLGAFVVLARAFSDITSLTGRRQLRWIAWGTALGVGPFAFGYALPWAMGIEPPVERRRVLAALDATRTIDRPGVKQVDADVL